MSQFIKWASSKFAFLHGDDSYARKIAVDSWKSIHVNNEWADFSFTTCSEGCSWSEVLSSLNESVMLSTDRVVLVPRADNLFDKSKKLPDIVKNLLKFPIPNVRLLLVSCSIISTGPGSIFSCSPFNEWSKQGFVLKVGDLDNKKAIHWIEDTVRSMKLHLGAGVAVRLVNQLGTDPGILRRTLEVLDLAYKNKNITINCVDKVTFRLVDQNIFAWTKAWQSGSIDQAIKSLHKSLEDDPSNNRHLILLGQARREVERLCRLCDANRFGIKDREALLTNLGLSCRQDFLLNGYVRVLDKIGIDDLQNIICLVNQADVDLKGKAVSKSVAVLVNLTIALCEFWKN